MLKLLIADKSESFCKALSDELTGRFSIRFCNQGKSVLDLCYSFEPDIIVLDLELPYLDGISILRTLRASGRNTEVVVTTACAGSDYVIRTLVQCGVQYALPRPCVISAVIARINEIVAYHCNREWVACDEISSLMLSVGMRLNSGGFSCVREALLLLMNDSTLPLTKVVYPSVAHICGGTGKRVEKAIRGAIKGAWLKRNDSIWRMYFTPGRDGQIECPTNGQFLARFAAVLMKRKIG